MVASAVGRLPFNTVPMRAGASKLPLPHATRVPMLNTPLHHAGTLRQPTIAMQIPLPAQAVPIVHGPSILQLLLVFISGGLFFSTVVAAIGAIYAFGIDNVQRARREVALVLRRTFVLLRSAVRAAWTAGFEEPSEGSTRWKAAASELRAGFRAARRAAAEGVEAISLQRDLYAAAVGIPGLCAAACTKPVLAM